MSRKLWNRLFTSIEVVDVEVELCQTVLNQIGAPVEILMCQR